MRCSRMLTGFRSSVSAYRKGNCKNNTSNIKVLDSVHHLSLQKVIQSRA